MSEDPYEYAAQWVSTATGYRPRILAKRWYSRGAAEQDVKELTKRFGHSKVAPWRFELVRRLKAGPVEVVESD